VTLAMQTVLDDLGKGLGPLVVALMISAWGRCAPGARACAGRPRAPRRSSWRRPRGSPGWCRRLLDQEGAAVCRLVWSVRCRCWGMAGGGEGVAARRERDTGRPARQGEGVQRGDRRVGAVRAYLRMRSAHAGARRGRNAGARARAAPARALRPRVCWRAASASHAAGSGCWGAAATPGCSCCLSHSLGPMGCGASCSS
jgi:hypothetical protein